MAIIAVLLTLPVGLCLFDGHHSKDGNHGMSPELCASLTAIPVSIVYLAKPAISGWFVPTPKLSSILVSSGPLYRPPEPSWLS